MATLIKIKDELQMLDNDLSGYFPVIRSDEWLILPGDCEQEVEEL